ncbi:hypothetical protein TcWFU_001197 [Taenia crassiceps]|uniref:Uncharacterized protein n=1 Tax=Taenia crassiceps TaxID=6207 RepID=A0ABR4Q912_9CEST
MKEQVELLFNLLYHPAKAQKTSLMEPAFEAHDSCHPKCPSIGVELSFHQRGAMNTALKNGMESVQDSSKFKQEQCGLSGLVNGPSPCSSRCQPPKVRLYPSCSSVMHHCRCQLDCLPVCLSTAMTGYISHSQVFSVSLLLHSPSPSPTLRPTPSSIITGLQLRSALLITLYSLTRGQRKRQKGITSASVDGDV